MKTEILVIDTDAYSGNFERELTGWITGAEGFDDVTDLRLVEQTQLAHPDLTAYFDKWEIVLATHTFDSEYNDTHCGIMTTPGWTNDGHGTHRKLEPGEKSQYSSYQSVGIAISRSEIGEGEAEFLATVKQLAEEFAADTTRRYIGAFEILGYRFVTETVVTTTEEVKF